MTRTFRRGLVSVAFVVFAAGVLASRFGGEQSSHSQPAQPVRSGGATIAPVVGFAAPAPGQANTPYFQELPGAIPNLQPLFDQIGPSWVTAFVPVDMNQDGRDDILMHVWKFVPGTPGHAGPCVNQLVVLIQQPNGSFLDETSSRLIGLPDLVACSKDRVVGDVNGDGRMDIAFSGSQEDGRSGTTQSDMYALNAVVVSQPDGRYAVERFGTPSWYYGVRLGVDSGNKPYVLFSNLTWDRAAMQRGNDGVWREIGDEAPPYVNYAATFFRPDGSAGPSTRLVEGGEYPQKLNVDGSYRDAQGWHRAPSLVMNPLLGQITMLGWNGDTFQTGVYRVDDFYMVDGGFLGGCLFRKRPAEPPVVVMNFNGAILPFDYTGPSQIVVQNELKGYVAMRGFRLDADTLSEEALNIAGQPMSGNWTAFFHDCGDVNGDGYDDLVVHATGNTGRPFVYVSNQAGGLRFIGESPFPMPSAPGNGSGDSVLHDFDRDGKVDFLTPWYNSSLGTFKLYYYKGIALLPNKSVPDVPRNLEVAVGNASTHVRFIAPLDDGGLPITGYTVVSTPAGGVDANAHQMADDHLVTGLQNGTSYRFQVVAENAMGSGNPSPKSTVVTPWARSLSISPANILEGNGGTTIANFVITLSGTSGSDVTVDVATVNGIAIAGSDYTAKAVPALTIPSGQTTAQFAVTVAGDTEVEAHERFTVNLGNAIGATITNGQALGTINNDDLTGLSISDLTVVEGDAGQRTASFVISLSEPMPTSVSFDIDTSSGSAASGGDFVPRSQDGRVIDPGRTRVLFEVQVVGDTAFESSETFNVLLSNVQGAIVAKGSAIGIIENDDAPASRVINRTEASRRGLLRVGPILSLP